MFEDIMRTSITSNTEHTLFTMFSRPVKLDTLSGTRSRNSQNPIPDTRPEFDFGYPDTRLGYPVPKNRISSSNCDFNFDF